MKPLRVIAGSVVTIALLVSGSRAEQVGPAETWVDSTRPMAYRIEGGSKDLFATGEICSLMKAFVAEGEGVTLKFTPKTTRRGRYSISRKVSGVEVDGRGDYEVQYDGPMAIGIVAGTGTFRLKRVPGGCAD